MGASACYHLAKKGFRVLGLDQFATPHSHGSHSGQTRIIRKAYYEHPDYIPLLQRAYHNWEMLEAEINRQLYFETGILYAGPAKNPILEGVKTSSSLYGIPVNELPHTSSGTFRLPADYELLFEPEAGYLLCEESIRALLEIATRHGADIRNNAKVATWSLTNDGVEVKTDRETFRAKRLIIAAGAWSAHLIPEAAGKLNVTRQILAWFATDRKAEYQLGNFPCWLIADPVSGGAYYGFPEDEEIAAGVKLALHLPAGSVEADNVSTIVTETDLHQLREFVKNHLPGLNGEIVDAKVCLYENSPDGNFVIDQQEETDGRVTFGWGFSGHGFKFASAIGEMLADLSVQGKTDLPIGFLSAKRFR